MKIIGRTTHILAAASLLGVVAMAQAPSASAGDRTSVRHAVSVSAAAKRESPDRVEGRIMELHAKLHIKPDQQAQWDAFAAVMRENASSIRTLMMEKHHNQATMSAVDDLNSYQDVAKAHVDGLARLIPTFAALYATMSEHQRKTADVLFGQHDHHDQRSSSN